MRLPMLIVVVSLACRLALADEPTEAENRKSKAATRAEWVFGGMHDARDRLRKGVVRAKGRQFVPMGEFRTIDSEATFTLAFDTDARLVRCEKEQEHRFVRAAGGRGDERWRTVSIDTPEQCIFFDQPAANKAPSQISIVAADQRRRPRRLGVFDIRTVCLMYPANFELKTPFEELYKAFADDAASSDVDKENGLVRVEQVVEDNSHRRVLWIDSRQGFTPVRLEAADRRITPIRDKTLWPNPVYVSTATWVEKNGVWVPATYRLDNLQCKDKNGRNEYHEFAFEWESVNEPLDKATFEIDSIKAPKGSVVINFTGERPVVESIIGMPGARREGVDLPMGAKAPPPRASNED